MLKMQLPGGVENDKVVSNYSAPPFKCTYCEYYEKISVNKL